MCFVHFRKIALVMDRRVQRGDGLRKKQMEGSLETDMAFAD